MENLISILFYSREIAHREHLKTTSFAQHKALNEFYDGIIDLADSISEAYQGRNGIMKYIPFAVFKVDGAKNCDKIKFLLKKVEEERCKLDKKDTAIQNIIDEIVGLYLSTIYKLEFLS